MYGGGGGHYDGGGGHFDGGGFMPSQSTAVPESSGPSKGRSAKTLLPLTVKQIMDAAQSSVDSSIFAIAGVDVSTVRLVGRMLNKVDHDTKVEFNLDDGTGKIAGNLCTNEPSDPEAKEMADVNVGDYAIVNGGLIGFQGKRQIIAYSVRRVTNFNEITHHFLHCIEVHLCDTRSKAQINASTEIPGHTNQVRLSNNQAALFSASGNAARSDISKLVLGVFNEPAVLGLEHGPDIKDVAARLNLPVDVVRAAIEKHLENGDIYNTIDDNHFRSAMNV